MYQLEETIDRGGTDGNRLDRVEFTVGFAQQGDGFVQVGPQVDVLVTNAQPTPASRTIHHAAAPSHFRGPRL